MKRAAIDMQSMRMQISELDCVCNGVRLMTVYSQALEGRADVSLFVPQGLETVREVPIVLLLHGVYGSHWSWFFQGGAHLTAQELMEQKKIRSMLIAAPSDGLRGDGTAYARWGTQDFETWICNDLLISLQAQFFGEEQRAMVFIAGLSMGGYGALRLGAKHAQRFCGISAHSAITEPKQFQDFIRDMTPLESVPREEVDVLHWIQRHRNELPPLRFDCGKEDSLFEANQNLHCTLTELNIPHRFAAYPGGHDWPYWRMHVKETLLFFEEILRSNDHE